MRIPFSHLPALLAAFGLAACQAVRETPAAFESGGDSLSACEILAREILEAPDRDILAAKATPAFARRLQHGFGPPGPIDFDPRFDSQDEIPRVTAIGRPVREGGTVRVPVALEFPADSNRPARITLSKTYVFVAKDGQWLLDDLLSSGPETPVPGSLRDSIDGIPEPFF